jgi:hypothetical protein
MSILLKKGENRGGKGDGEQERGGGRRKGEEKDTHTRTEGKAFSGL